METRTTAMKQFTVSLIQNNGHCEDIKLKHCNLSRNINLRTQFRNHLSTCMLKINIKRLTCGPKKLSLSSVQNFFLTYQKNTRRLNSWSSLVSKTVRRDVTNRGSSRASCLVKYKCWSTVKIHYVNLTIWCLKLPLKIKVKLSRMYSPCRSLLLLDELSSRNLDSIGTFLSPSTPGLCT